MVSQFLTLKLKKALEMTLEELSYKMMLENLKKFEQNMSVFVNKTNDLKPKLNFPLSFTQIANILGFLINFSVIGNQQEIIDILSVISDSKKFYEKKYQDLFIKVLEHFEDKDFKFLSN